MKILHVNNLTMTIKTASPHSKSRTLDLVSQVALDLAHYLDGFSNKNFGIRILANESGVNERTIKRLLARKNQPSAPTLFKLYMTFTEKLEVSQMLKDCPEVIRNEIKDKCPDKNKGKKFCKTNFLELIEADPLMGELYVLAGTGPLFKDSVSFRFGQYGVELLDKLEELQILMKKDRNTYVLGGNSPTFDGPVIKSIGTRFVKRFCKPGMASLKGNNVMNFYAEGLNAEGLQEWIKTDEEAFKKKVMIANDPKYRGDKPVFSFTATDTMEMEK